MKKILYLITSSEYGGAQKYVLDLAANLPTADYQAIVAAGEGDGELFKRLKGLPGVEIVKLSNLKRMPSPITARRGLKEIIGLLVREQPDILHLNSSMAGFLGSWAARIYKKRNRANLKVIYTVHGWVFSEPGFLKPLVYFLVEKISAKWKDAFIVLSERDLKAGVRKKIAPENKFIKIHNGLDIESLQFLPKEQAREVILKNFCDENKIIIGTLANLYATKGLPYLIKAARIIAKERPEVGFVVIGEGPERKALEKLTARLGLRQTFFLTGTIPSAARYLAAFDIFVLPSIKEGLPYAVLEAMAAGLPIVATYVGGVPELIENDKSGLLVEPRNPAALARALGQLLGNPAQQKNLAHAARQRVEKLSLTQMLNQTYSLY
ncbi:MAG: glycosyltransferase family 4 protein [Candidatus Pacebacteria bacterium]|nr:glycosyltransferase family 4 protein [Candidatus Paceibacterota bacterium]